MAFWGIYDDVEETGQKRPADGDPATKPAAKRQHTTQGAKSGNVVGTISKGPQLNKKPVREVMKPRTLMTPRSLKPRPLKPRILKKKPARVRPRRKLSTPQRPPYRKKNEPVLAPMAMPESLFPGNIADPYDPRKPNEYDDYLIDKKKLAAIDSSIPMPMPTNPFGEITASLQHVDTTLKQPLVEVSKKPKEIVKQDESDDDDDIDGEDIDGEDIDGLPIDLPGGLTFPLLNTQEPVKPVQPQKPRGKKKAKKQSFGEKILKSYGWKGKGHGVGKQEQGIAVPIMARQTGDGRQGVIIDKNARQQAQGNINTSRVVLLRNMVGAGEVDPALEQEVGEECGKYGVVLGVIIIETPMARPDQAVRIFVQFQRREEAVKAIKDLNGRFFGGRVVSAQFFSESLYEKRQLAPSRNEM